MIRTKEEFKNIYKKNIESKNMTKEEAIEYLEGLEFIIDMRDCWDEEDRNAMSAISELLKELKGVK